MQNDIAVNMFPVVLSCFLLIGFTTFIHYEALSILNARLPALRIPVRTKLLVVIFGAFFTHATEIVLYGLAFYALDWAGYGSLGGPGGSSLGNCMYFSAGVVCVLRIYRDGAVLGRRQAALITR